MECVCVCINSIHPRSFVRSFTILNFASSFSLPTLCLFALFFFPSFSVLCVPLFKY